MIVPLLLLLATQDPLLPPEQAPDPLPTAPAAPADSEAPVIEDVAAAAANPRAAPVITVMMSDRGSGVGAASVFFRGKNQSEWQRADLRGGSSGLFIARLPDGLQRTGFEYYIEAHDLAGNGPANIGDAQAPIVVDAATRATQDVIEEQRAAAEVGPAIHPAWLMISLGVGVLAGAGAGAYGLDLVATSARLDEVNDELGQGGLSEARRGELTAVQGGLESAARGDAIITTILGVVAVAALGTGVTLVVMSSLE